MKPFWALLLAVSAPSLGTWAAFYGAPGTALGKGLFGFSKLWILIFPLLWTRFVEKKPLRISRPTFPGMRAGIFTGLAIFAGILTAWALFGAALIDPATIQIRVAEVGLGSKTIFILGALYWCTVNSVLEEYFWRWFVYHQCEQLWKPRVAVVASGFFFTLHHVVALSGYMGPMPNLLCNVGIFIGGVTWSALYLKYRSVWPGYVSHVFADLAVFGLAWRLIF